MKHTVLPKSIDFERHPLLSITLYIKLTRGQTPKGEVEKNYLICYPTWEKKETSCKEIG